jgi:transcriptional regulator with XRE-family HTH domain
MEELKRLRKAKGLSQAKLAALADLDPSTVSQIETGARRANTRTLEKLAAVLGVEVSELFPKGQAPLPLEDRPSLEEFHAKAGCTTDWLLKPASEWYAAFRAKSREEAREKLLRIAREVEEEYLAIEPELFDAMKREKALDPDNVWRRGSCHTLWQAAVGRYIQVWDAVPRALADTDDPPPEPDFPTVGVGGGSLISMRDEEMEELLEKRSADKDYALS